MNVIFWENNSKKYSYYDTTLDCSSKKNINILLIHSFPANKDIFIEHIKLLKHKYRIISIDLPGFGQSDEPSEYSTNFFSNWINELIKYLQLHQKVQLFGVFLLED